MPDIYINNQQDGHLISEDEIKNTIQKIYKSVNIEQKGELSVSFVNDDEIARLNLQYRQKEGPTDVLTFPQSEGMEMPTPEKQDYQPLLGDIIISTPTASRQAEQRGHSLKKEITILLIHGILHLYGYDHITDEQQGLMNKQEKIILSALEKSEAF